MIFHLPPLCNYHHDAAIYAIGWCFTYFDAQDENTVYNLISERSRDDSSLARMRFSLLSCWASYVVINSQQNIVSGQVFLSAFSWQDVNGTKTWNRVYITSFLQLIAQWHWKHRAENRLANLMRPNVGALSTTPTLLRHVETWCKFIISW